MEPTTSALPQDAAWQASSARYHLSALQTCLERLEQRHTASSGESNDGQP
jgi:hypothetical protein